MSGIGSFLKKYNVPHCKIWYYLNEEGDKICIGENNNLKKSEIKTRINLQYFQMDDHGNYILLYKSSKGEEKKWKLKPEEFKSLEVCYSVYLKHTDDIYCIDIDDENIKSIEDLIAVNPAFEFLRGCAYLQGNRKGLHIYCKVKNVPEYGPSEVDLLNWVKGDFIHRANNMWEKQQKRFIGEEIKEYEFEDIKHIFNEKFYGKKTTQKKLKKINDLEDPVYSPIEIDEKDRQILNLLSADWYNHGDKWRLIGWILKNCGFPFDDFDNFSKKSIEKYKSRDDCIRVWEKASKKNINVGLLRSILKHDNHAEYMKLYGVGTQSLTYLFSPEEEEDEKKNIVKMTDEYLLPKECERIEDEAHILQKNIIQFFNDESIKILNLKSPYDTGKTAMIKKILTTFTTQRILWLSYRKTLTCDIYGNFKDFGFKDYQERDYQADRLIIQLESILKIDSSHECLFTDENYELNSYDLVIIDESESVLKQFNSPTFKNGSSKDCFNFVKGVLTNSKKIICMDGDLGDRTYSFTENFGKSINIVNDIKKNHRKFIITENSDFYYMNIKRDLQDNKKIVIVSMSATKCIEYQEQIKKDIEKMVTDEFPLKNILCYTGSSSDISKSDFKNVIESWSKADILIYSPTCESGVNFDKEHFDKIYGVFSKSTSSRQYFQMLSRVRKIKDDKIMILNRTFDIGVNLNSKPIDKNVFWTFDEVKDSIKLLGDVKSGVELEMQNGKMVKIVGLNSYDTNYIYNKMEDLNNGTATFLKSFHNLAILKGHTVQYLNDFTRVYTSLFDEDVQEVQKIQEEEKKVHVSSIGIVLSSKDINDEEFEEALKRQERDNATEEDKRSINKHVWKKSLGLDYLNEDILKRFSKDSVKNFVSLISEDNIPDFEDLQTVEFRDKSRMLKSIINDLGFNHIFDKKKILSDDFEKFMKDSIKKNPVFTDLKNTQIRFGLERRNKELENTKQFLGFVNSLFSEYHVKISFGRKQEKGEVKNIYKLEFVNGINELLEYKIIKGYSFYDPAKIRSKPMEKDLIYKSLINMQKIKEEKEKQEAHLKALGI
jgi:hypothetical protein